MNEQGEITQAIEALEGSIKLIGSKVISNVMPAEQEANFIALAQLKALKAKVPHDLSENIDVVQKYKGKTNGAVLRSAKILREAIK